MSVLFAYVTAPNRKEAKALAGEAVRQGLAACGNIIGPISSIYEWQGDICDDEEWVLILKTTKAKAEALKQAVVKAHSYDCPCVVFLPIEDGHPAFLDWVQNQCR